MASPPTPEDFMEMHPFWQVLDPLLIWFFRLTGRAALDFVIGTLALAMICLFVGELTVRVAARFIGRRLARYTDEAAKYHSLSMDALRAGDQAAYKAANTLANDAFGHTFFQQATLSAAFLWPVFFALGWMQYRFLEIEFPIPGTGLSLGFIGIFIILYIVAYFSLKWLKKAWWTLKMKSASPPACDPSPTSSVLTDQPGASYLFPKK